MNSTPNPESPSNPIHDLLDDIGFPRLTPFKELIASSPIEKDESGLEHIIITTKKPFFDGFTNKFRAYCNPELKASPYPKTHFDAYISKKDFMRMNVELNEKLRSPVIKNEKGYFYKAWIFKSSSIQIKGWTHTYPSPLIDRFDISIDTGFRIPISLQERDWLNSFKPIGKISHEKTNYSIDEIVNKPSNILYTEFIREPEEGMQHMIGHVGISEDKNALILFNEELMIIPAEQIYGFLLINLMQAKGGGGVFFNVHCRRSTGETVEILIQHHIRTYELDTFAKELSSALNKELTVWETFDA